MDEEYDVDDGYYGNHGGYHDNDARSPTGEDEFDGGDGTGSASNHKRTKRSVIFSVGRDS